MRIPSHSTIAAYGALFVALGGTGYAATQLEPNSVGTQQIRNGSVQSRDLARGVLSRKNAKLAAAITDVVTDPASGVQIQVSAHDGKDGLPGPQGPQGDAGAPSSVQGPQGVQGMKGDTGPMGQALGYAHVMADGSLDASHSTSNAVVTLPPDPFPKSDYCVDATNATVKNLYVTNDADGSLGYGFAVRVPPAGTECDGHAMEVIVTNTSNQPAQHAFFVTLNG